MAADLAKDKFWVNKYLYHDAEKMYHEGMSKDGVGMTNVSKDPCIKSPLAVQVAKARELIKSSMQRVDGMSQALTTNDKANCCNVHNAQLNHIITTIDRFETIVQNLIQRVKSLEMNCNQTPVANAVQTEKKQTQPQAKPKEDDDDDVDLFGSDSEEEDEEAKRVREQRLEEYAAKKSKKPALVAKSNIILDIKPWNDETDMKKLEESVRKVEMPGLVWGASKLIPLVFGIYKLQISCVVEDEKVSVDELTEILEGIEEYVQSVDIAAFNKV